MMNRFEKDVLQYIRENQLLQPGMPVAVGFSGGPDSVCLLHVLQKLQKVLRLHLLAVHVHHKIRGEEADRDADFCRRMAEEQGIPYREIRVDVPALVKERGMSLEEAARLLRYEALEMAAAEFAGETAAKSSDSSPARIAVAHHADDQAETILLNLCRGSGLKGLRGMLPRRDNIIRPLLMKSRQEILDYIAAEGLPYVTDSTNLETDAARNRMRLHVLPVLAEEINSKAAEHIGTAGAMIREADDFLVQCAGEYLDSLSETADNADTGNPGSPKAAVRSISLGQSALKEKPQILRRYVIIEALRRLGVPMKDWGEQHIRDIDRALFGHKGYHLDLPGGVYADNAYRETRLYYPESTDTVTGTKS